MKYSFIIPVYNEKKNIGLTIAEIKKKFERHSSDYEIIFVDDNSPDGTALEIENFAKVDNRIKLCQHGKKIGLGAAINFGYKKALGEFIIGIDVDLSQSIDDLIKMISYLKNNNLDMVIGSRYIEGGKQINKSFIRDAASRYMNIFISTILNLKVYDLSHTFRIFRREIFLNISSSLHETGHPSFMTEFTYFTVKKKYKVSEFPIIFVERDPSLGKSKLKISKEIFPYFKFVLKLLTK